MNAADLRLAFADRVTSLQKVRVAGERGLSTGVLQQQELDHLYEATFLGAVARFEAFQNELFYAALLDRAGIRGVRPALGFSARARAERFVLATERSAYLSWTRPKESIARARTFLVGGRPFSRLERRDRDRELLGTVFTIRNAIAHRSGAAIEKFRNLPSVSGLAPSRRCPAAYLRQIVTARSQHENLCIELVRLASALSATSDLMAQKYLLSERPYRSGDEVKGGKYRCVKCGAHLAMPLRLQPLSRCACNVPCAGCGRSVHSEFERV